MTALYDHYYLINIVLVLTLLYALYRTSDLILQLFLIFTYCSLHYAYGYIPVFLAGAGTKFMIQRSSPHLFVNSLALAFILLSALIIFFKNQKILFQQQAVVLRSRVVPLFLGMVLVWFVSNLVHLASIKSLAITSFILLYAGMLALIVNGSDKTQLDASVRRVTPYLFMLLLLIFIAQCLQIIVGKAWVCCSLLRPASFLFNPNNLGYWLLSINAMFSYTYINGHYKKLSMLAIAMVAISSFLAASRSYFAMIVFFHLMLILFSMTTKQEKLAKVFNLSAIFYLTFLTVCLPLHYMSPKMSVNVPQLYRLQISSDRFFYLPSLLYHYVFKRETHQAASHVAPHTASSPMTLSDWQLKKREAFKRSGISNIEGRLSRDSTDDAYILMWHKEGRLVTLLWLLILLSPVFLIFMSSAALANMNVLIMTACYISLLCSGLTMNIFTVFPAWLILSISLSMMIASSLYYGLRQTRNDAVVLGVS